MKKLLLILLCLPFIGFGQNVYIPDANFKAYLVGEPSINTNGDSEIQVSEAASFNDTIDCDNNQLTSIDVSNNLALNFLYCSDNLITNLDISSNTFLYSLFCYGNQLINLNVKNGNNFNWLETFEGITFRCANNPSLTCIEVDDVAFSDTNWTVANGYIDPQHYFSNNCTPSAIQEQSTNKQLLKVTDLLGRETKQTNQPLFYIYDDGTVEKRIIIE